ncbi:hypothetical protein IMCC3317_01910 [Kordia antarctica]|uniref:Cytochrome oxidase complex assembly protein 1 n=1 Tax=Kordia antarctica TaxID=1218801 RepID=A0A7L4ZF53_9FLAO|nr:cytochrome c oxidase assembly factor Coa1 family protein [Kordia antarctica]QHI34846.1 hypothetical protein IMCC3317_01910 [Kordia antarctica]
MNTNIIESKPWWKRNWKSSLGLVIIMLILLSYVFSSNFGAIVSDYTKAYADPTLFELPLEKVRANKRVQETLGTIEPIDNMTILNGEVQYSNDNKMVTSTIKITGEHGKAMLDIFATFENNSWLYKKIIVRIKNPPEKKETIQILETAIVDE